MTTSSTGPETRREDTPGSLSSGLRALVLRLHFYAGVLVAPFLLVAAASGLLYACSWQAEKIIYAEQLRVPAAAERLPLERQIGLAREARPDGRVLGVRPSAGAGETTRVLMSADGLGASEKLAVYVDPYRGTVKGELPVYGGSEALPVRAWLSKLHADLHLGEPGRYYSEFAASRLWAVAGGGLVLWISRRRRRRRDLLVPERGTSGRRRTLSLHGTVGLWSAAGLLFLSATGLTWSVNAGARIDEIQTALKGVTPTLEGASAAHHGSGALDHAHHPGGGADADRILAAAGLGGPVEIVYPARPGEAVVSSRSTGAGRRTRTRRPSTPTPPRSSTPSASPTTRSSPSSPASASRRTRASSSAWRTRSCWRSSPSGSSSSSAGAT